MKIQYNKPGHDRQKWILSAIIVILLLITIFFAVLYIKIEKNKEEGMDHTREMVLNNTDIVTIDQIDRFNGSESYHIIFGETDEKEAQVIFVPLTKDEDDYLTIKQEDIISEAAIKKNWQNECDQCKFIKLVPGIVDDKEVWELTYIDNKNRYIFEYRSLYDGEQYEKLQFTRLFN